MKLQRYEERIADLKDANRFIGEKIQINIGKIEKLNMKIKQHYQIHKIQAMHHNWKLMI